MVRKPVTIDVKGMLVFLGTGTSHGVPMIGCDCEVCTSEDPRNNRTRCGVVMGLPEGNLLIDTPPDWGKSSVWVLRRKGNKITHSKVWPAPC